MSTIEQLVKRITDYLAGGGLFNPEQANHDAVHGLLIDCRDAFSALPAAPAQAPAAERERIAGAVARGWCHEQNAYKVMDVDLAMAIVDEVLALAATPAPQAVSADPEDDLPACEASDWAPPAGYDGDGSVDAMAARATASSAPAEQGELAASVHYRRRLVATLFDGARVEHGSLLYTAPPFAAPPAAQPAEPPEKGTAGWLIAELSKWPAGAVVHGHQSLLRQFRVSDVFAAGDGNDGADTGNVYLWLDAESEEDAAMADAIDAAPHPSQPAEPQRVGPTNAARDVLSERERQVNAEGWSPEHDDEHDFFEMAQAAACYAMDAARIKLMWPHDTLWPWDRKWWKPSTPRRNLVKAGALILAEIERLDRIPAPTGSAAPEAG